MSDPTLEQAAWSWTQHLVEGGTKPWADWIADGSGRQAVVPPGWTPPGAAQLELVRRLGLTGRVEGPVLRGVADLVLGRSGPGRGLAQQPLSWPHDAPRFGAPAVDPAAVPDEELVRVGVGTLTELLLAAPTRPDEVTSVRRRRFTRTPAFVLAGAPVTTSVVRRDLAASGHAEGGRSPEVVLLVEPLDATLVEVWSARVQRGAPVRWPGFVRRWAARPDLPPSADYPALARRWAEQVGVEHVHLVVAAGADATDRVAEVLGLDVEPSSSASVVPRWKPLTPAAVDVARRVNAVLAVRVEPARRDRAVRDLAALLAARGDHGRGLTVPSPFAGWASARAGDLAGDLRAGGYPVHGDLDRVAPRSEGLPGRPSRAAVLRTVVDACLDQAVENTNAGRRVSGE